MKILLSYILGLTGLTSSFAQLGQIGNNSVHNPITIIADLSQNQGPFNHTPGGYLSSVMGRSGFDQVTWDHINALDIKIARIWMYFSDMCDTITRETKFTLRNSYLERWDNTSDTLLLNWRTNYELIGSGSWTESDLQKYTIDALSYIKTKCPSLKYIECDNEKMDWGMEDNYNRYKFLYKVVNEVNSKDLPGSELLIGGPVTSCFCENYIRPWLDFYKADTNPGKRLDFISYHEYLFTTKDQPALVANQRFRLDSMLANRGIPSLPVFVTETGMFQGSKTSSLSINEDYHIQAAGLAMMHFYFQNQSRIYPFHWSVFLDDMSRKNFFVAYNGGVPRPYYLMVQMQHMLPPTRFLSTADLTVDGLGIASMCGASSSQIAVMTWNYQWQDTAIANARTVLLSIKNFPAEFKTASIKVEKYLVDTDYHSGELLKAATKYISGIGDGEYKDTSLLNPNALRIILLSIDAPGSVNDKGFSISSPGIRLYPNPVQEDFALDATEMFNEVKISNIYGQELRTILLRPSTSVIITTRALQQGIYIVAIYKNQQKIGVIRFYKTG